MSAGGEDGIDGRVERVHDGIVEGWAWRADAPEERVSVRVALDGEEVGIARAELPRPTLAAAGIGDGAHGFRLALPDALAGEGVRVLTVRAGERELPGGERELPAAGGFTVQAGEGGAWAGVGVTVAAGGVSAGGVPGVDEPPPRSVDGRIDRIADGVIDGWVWRPAAESDRVEVEIVLDGEPVGTTVAQLPRPSLVAAGIGDGEHAFRFVLPDARAHPGAHTLRVVADRETLGPAGGFIVRTDRTDNPWYGARFVVEDGAAAAARGPAPPTYRSSGSEGQRRYPPAVVGRGGWLFDGAVLDPSDGPLRADRIEAAVAALLETLGALAERVSEMGCRLLPVLCPMKELVYRDELPAEAGAGPMGDVRPGQLVLRGLFDHPTLDSLDLLPVLEAAASERLVFSPTAPLLSEWGGYCAYRAVIKRIAMILPQVEPPVELAPTGLLEAPPRRWRGPVAMLTASGLVPCSGADLPDPPGEPVVVAPDGAAEWTPREHLARLRTRLAVGWELPHRRELARALLIGGPEHEALGAWAARHFRFTVLIGHESPVVDLVSLERPDVIVYLIEERALVVPAAEE